MKMNSFEKALVNNPVRTWMLRGLARHFLGAGSLAGKRVLEIECRQGAGTHVLLNTCGADNVTAFDYDPAQLARAKRRHANGADNRIALFLGDAVRLPFPDASFDVVVEFAILHHVPEWRQALREIARVLRPGGLLMYEEYLRGFTNNPITKLFLEHPSDGMFVSVEFYTEFESVGLTRNTRQGRAMEWWLSGTANR